MAEAELSPEPAAAGTPASWRAAPASLVSRAAPRVARAVCAPPGEERTGQRGPRLPHGVAGGLAGRDRPVQLLLGTRRQLVQDRPVIADHLRDAGPLHRRRRALRARSPFVRRGRLVAVATRQVEELRQPPVRHPLAHLAQQRLDRNDVRLALLVLELQLARRAVPGEVDAERRFPRDRVDQVDDRPQLGRHDLAPLRQRPGDPVALLLVTQPAAGRRRDVHHELEVPRRLVQQRLRRDRAQRRAGQVDDLVPQQEPLAVVQQLPRQRQQHVVVAAQRHQRPRPAGDLGRIEHGSTRRFAEQQLEQQPAERPGVAVQLGALRAGLGRLLRELLKAEPGYRERCPALPGRRHRPLHAGRVDDLQAPVLDPIEHEHQVLPQGERPGVAFAQLVHASDRAHDLRRNRRRIAPGRVDLLDRLEQRRELDRFEHHDHDPIPRSVLRQKRGPLLLDPRRQLAARRRDQHQEPAGPQRGAQLADVVVRCRELSFIEVHLEPGRLEHVAQRAHPGLVGRRVRQEHVVDGWLVAAGADHARAPFPRTGDPKIPHSVEAEERRSQGKRDLGRASHPDERRGTTRSRSRPLGQPPCFCNC